MVSGRDFDHVRLRAARIAAGLTQHELADAVGVKQPTVSQWENGVRSPRATKLSHLAELLGIEVTELVAPIPDDNAPRLGDYRQALGLSQASLAARLVMRPSTVGAIEVGSHFPNNDSHLIAWCELLGITIDEFEAAWWQGRHKHRNG